MKLNRWIAAAAMAALSSTALTATAWAFQEAPMLADMVEAGTLPPVDERLPTHPTVVDALEVGQMRAAKPCSSRATSKAIRSTSSRPNLPSPCSRG